MNRTLILRRSRSRTVSFRVLDVAIRTAAFALLATAAVGCGVTTSDKDIKGISLAEVKAITDAPAADRRELLIDPRPKVDYAAGHIPGAVWVNLPDVSAIPGQTDPALARYSRLVVYGDDPGSSTAKAMTKKLMAVGYSDVKMFVGGLAEWKRAGFPVETGAK